MVDVAQLVEPRVVIPVVVGSNPIVHPIFFYIGPLAQLVEQLTLNQLVAGSNPARPTIYSNQLTVFLDYAELVGNNSRQDHTLRKVNPRN